MDYHERKLKEKKYTHILYIHIYIYEYMNVEIYL